MTTDAIKNKPLQGFNKLSKTVLLYTPDAPPEIRKDGIPQPDLILFFSWMGASPKHIEKYTAAYQTRYAHRVPILLIQSDLDDFMFRSMSKQKKFIKPAVTYLDSFLKENPDARILMHSFSNGGAWSAVKLARAWKPNRAFTNTNNPIVAVIMDSSPSLPHFGSAYNAMTVPLATQPLPIRLLGSMFVVIMLTIVMLMDILGIQENMLYVLRREINDPAYPYIRADRVYICSESDKMVGIDGVIAHSQETLRQIKSGVLGDEESRRWTVRVEEFEGSTHVGHVRVDEPRYWSIVDEIWQRGVASSRR